MFLAMGAVAAIAGHEVALNYRDELIEDGTITFDSPEPSRVVRQRGLDWPARFFGFCRVRPRVVQLGCVVVLASMYFPTPVAPVMRILVSIVSAALLLGWAATSIWRWQNRRDRNIFLVKRGRPEI